MTEENLYKKISYYLGILPIGAIFGLAAFMAQIEIKDLDLWLHLGMGRFIMQHHFVPNYDVLSCTVAGQPWINHEWLFQIIVFNLFKYSGSNGLIAMQVVLVIATLFLLLFLGYSKENQLPVAFFLLMVYLVYMGRFTTRPDLFSLFFFATYMYLLAIHVDKKWMPFILCLVQVLWVNIHGFFFFGPIFLAIAVLSEWIKRNVKLPYEWNEIGRLEDSEYKRLIITFWIIILACFVNPFFYKGALYPLTVFFGLHGENKVFFDYIQELQRPIALNLNNVFDQGKVVHYKLLILVSFMSFVFNRRKIDISAFFIWLIFLLFSLSAVRNLSFFAFAAYLVIMSNFLTIPFENIIPIRFTETKFKYLTESVGKFLLLMFILNLSQGMTASTYYDLDKYDYKSEFKGISLKSYPTKAVDFLVRNKIQGNFLNDFNSGAYLVGRTHPRIKVFIDGRTEVYGGEYFKFYQKVWEMKEPGLLDRTLEHYKITGAFLHSARQHIPRELLRYFYNNKDWVPVYFDDDAMIFLKNTVFNQPFIEKTRIDISKTALKKIDLVRLGVTQTVPMENFFRAFSLESIDLDDLALAECEMALKINPMYGDVYNLIGKIYAKRGNYQEAFEKFRLAASISPQDKDRRYNMALALTDLKNYKAALEEYKKIAQAWPTEPKSYFFLAKAYMLDQQYKEGIDALKKAYQMDKRAVLDIFKIADLLLEKKEYKKAVEVYEIPLTEKNYQLQAYNKIADVQLLDNNPAQAIATFKKMIAIDPNLKDISEKVRNMEMKLL